METNLTYLGIDPGQKGGIAVISKGRLTAWYGEPNAVKLFEIIKQWQPRAVYMEKAQTMPKQGIISAFTYGVGFGELLGVLQCTETQHYLFHPRIWQSKMFIGTGSHLAPKFRASTVFRRVFPEVAPRIANKVGRLHDGIVDAALICMYGIKHL